MRFSKNIPEIGKILQRWGISVSDSTTLSAVLCVALTAFNLIVMFIAAFLPVAWYTIAPLAVCTILWNLIFALSIAKQVVADQTEISKNRVLFRRFQNTTKYFESMLQDTSDIIISLDKDYLIFKFNTGAQKLFGYTQEDILGKPFELLFLNGADREKLYVPGKTGTGVKPASAEITMKTKDKQRIIVNMCMSKMRDGGFVVTAQDITEKKFLEEQLKQKSEQLNRLAITDDLTGLYNSRHFYVAIKGELSRLNRHPDRKLSLLYMDVDKFKEYNDSEGHLMGDNVLKSLGEVISLCLRKDVDTAFRYGGDEFVITLPDTDMNQAKIVADRILEQFCALKIGNTSLSIGIAEAVASDDEKSLVKRADAAMYVSKKKGGRQVSLSQSDIA